MPDHLAPGIHVEEAPAGPRPIQGVGTSTAAFAGPARYGPIVQVPPPITSLAEFERLYGDSLDISFHPGIGQPHYLWYSARAFFAEGGTRLHICRIFRPLGGAAYSPPAATLVRDLQARRTGERYNDGHGRASIRSAATETGKVLLIRARFPGAAGNLGIRLAFRHGPNILGGSTARPLVGALSPHDVVLIDAIRGGNGMLARAAYNQAHASWSFAPAKGRSISLAHLDPARHRIRVISMDVTVDVPHAWQAVWTGLPLDPRHAGPGGKDSLLARFARRPASDGSILDLPFELLPGKGLGNGLALIDLFASVTPDLHAGLLAPDDAQAVLALDCRLGGGHDGALPEAEDYAGRNHPGRSGLKRLETTPDIAIVAAPAAHRNVIPFLIRHCERMRHRVAILDSDPGQDVDRILVQARDLAATQASSHAALYYPWLLGRDAGGGRPLPLPPSGFVAGIYARTDQTRGVWKAPANEAVTSALGVESAVTAAQQDTLNPAGVNCLREFPGRGLRVWGARTLSADPEWKYVNVRRYICYLERSMEEGTRWVVFEPNGEPLWARVRSSVENFLYDEWRKGALRGGKPDEACFVRCDRGTMTRNDLDHGRLICLVGVAPVKPAEFVIIRMGQGTADATA